MIMAEFQTRRSTATLSSPGMHSLRAHVPFSPVSLCATLVVTLLVAYIGLIAMVMSYGVVTVEFTQSVRSDESELAQLESKYLDKVAEITSADYAALGYAKPVGQVFVRAESATALR